MAATLEDSFVRKLKFSGIDRTQLKELVDAAADIEKSGFRIEDVFPKGIVNPDGVTVKGSLPISSVGLLKDLLTKYPRVGGITVFPRGLPIIDNLRVNIDLR